MAARCSSLTSPASGWCIPAQLYEIAPMMDRLGLGKPEDGASAVLAKNATVHYCIVTIECGDRDQAISLPMLEVLALGFYTGYLGRVADEEA